MLTTKVGFERMASFLNAFPLILDDTNAAHDTKALQQIIYMFSTGAGKMRGSLESHWNGDILDSKETVFKFAQSMTWKGKHPHVTCVNES